MQVRNAAPPERARVGAVHQAAKGVHWIATGQLAGGFAELRVDEGCEESTPEQQAEAHKRKNKKKGMHTPAGSSRPRTEQRSGGAVSGLS